MTKDRFDADKLRMPAAEFDEMMRRALGAAPPVQEDKKDKAPRKRAPRKPSK